MSYCKIPADLCKISLMYQKSCEISVNNSIIQIVFNKNSVLNIFPDYHAMK